MRVPPRVRNRYVLLAGLLTFAAAAWLAIAWLSHWLVLSEPLAKADAIVVLGGQTPIRALEAARIYHQGWAAEVWLTYPPETVEERELASQGVGYVREHEYSRRVLEKAGVPAGAIQALENPTINTEEEVRELSKRLAARGQHRLIIVTSKAHTRRVRIIWRMLAAEGLEAVVRYAPADPFSGNDWWKNSSDVLIVAREVGGIANAWLGFPLKPRRAEEVPSAAVGRSQAAGR